MEKCTVYTTRYKTISGDIVLQYIQIKFYAKKLKVLLLATSIGKQ